MKSSASIEENIRELAFVRERIDGGWREGSRKRRLMFSFTNGNGVVVRVVDSERFPLGHITSRAAAL